MSLVRMEPLDDGLVRVVLASPKVNAMGSQLLAQLTVGLEGLASNDKVTGALLTGEGKCFSAGLDLKEVIDFHRPALIDFLTTLDRTFRAAFAFPKPLACAVGGHAIAGGMVLALATDHFALGAGGHRLGLTEVAVGVPFPRSALEIVRTALPDRTLRRLVLQPDTVTADEAHPLGIGDSYGNAPEDAAVAWLRQAVSHPAVPFARAKLQIRELALERWDRLAAGDRERVADAILSDSTRTALRKALG